MKNVYDPKLPLAQRLLALRVALANPSCDAVRAKGLHGNRSTLGQAAAGIRHAVAGRRVFVHAHQFTVRGVA